MAKLISKVYGEALFETAVEENRQELFQEEAGGILKVLDENPEFDRFMKHPGIPKQEKLEVVRNVFQGRISTQMAGFLDIVVRKERYGQLRAIFGYFLEKTKEEKKVGTAYVATAVELNEIQKAQVVDRLLATTSYREMEVHYATEPALIGGMVVRIKDRVVDSSIRTKLNNLTKQLLQIQIG
ncbi:MAG: ATP synthase F1 subunit delta [Clostridium sp.]|jgi:F-type H+-transporting ATPase subunit delta|nr:ATP synthase F1 subunit delta [Clostridium sp.]